VARVAILGGTGAAFGDLERILVETPFGDVEVLRDRDIILLPRHGTQRLPAHRVNHKANVEALARCKVDAVLALNSVGALHDAIPTGALLVPHDQLDMRSRQSFFDDMPVHVAFDEPYCADLRALLTAAAPSAIPRGVYAATEGPRLETPAEVRALRTLGGDVVGMTGAPEAALARERGLCYASLCLVTNPAAGVGGARVSATQIRDAAAKLHHEALRAAREAAGRVRAPRTCACARAARDGSI
jgi:5'-methylthioadenosine phosphorylase